MVWRSPCAPRSSGPLRFSPHTGALSPISSPFSGFTSPPDESRQGIEPPSKIGRIAAERFARDAKKVVRDFYGDKPGHGQDRADVDMGVYQGVPNARPTGFLRTLVIMCQNEWALTMAPAGEIDQGTSSLCGPSALVRTIALTDPLAYVTFIISLFETGRGEIGDLKVAAGDDVLNYDPGLQVPAVDWIPTAIIRDSENWFFDYQAAENQFAGITLPSHMEEWFKKIGFREVINDTNLALSKNENNLRGRLVHGL